MSEHSKNKYLKYKTKYLKLKNQIAGGIYLETILPDEIELKIINTPNKLTDEQKIGIVKQRNFASEQTFIELTSHYNLEDILKSRPKLNDKNLISLFKFTNYIRINVDDYDDPEDPEDRDSNINELLKNESRVNVTKIVTSTFRKYETLIRFSNEMSHILYLNIININFHLNESLNALKNLKHLRIVNYDFQLDNSLRELTNLNTLILVNYNHPLGDNLRELTNLNELYLGSYNHPLGDSLRELTNLNTLSLNHYNYPLGDSLNKLINLKTLTLDHYNHPLGESLILLTQLETIDLFSFQYARSKEDGDALAESVRTLSKLKSFKIRNHDLFGHISA